MVPLAVFLSVDFLSSVRRFFQCAKDIEEQFFVEHGELFVDGVVEEFGSLHHEYPRISGAVFDDGVFQFFGHQSGGTRTVHQVFEQCQQVVARQRLDVEAASDSGAKGYQRGLPEFFGQPIVAAQNSGEQAVGVEVDASE